MGQLLALTHVEAPFRECQSACDWVEQRWPFESGQKISEEAGWLPVIRINQSLSDLSHDWERKGVA